MPQSPGKGLVQFLYIWGNNWNDTATENVLSLMGWIIILDSLLFANKVYYEQQSGVVGYPDGKNIWVLPKKVIKSSRKMLT